MACYNFCTIIIELEIVSSIKYTRHGTRFNNVTTVSLFQKFRYLFKKINMPNSTSSKCTCTFGIITPQLKEDRNRFRKYRVYRN